MSLRNNGFFSGDSIYYCMLDYAAKIFHSSRDASIVFLITNKNPAILNPKKISITGIVHAH